MIAAEYDPGREPVTVPPIEPMSPLLVAASDRTLLVSFAGRIAPEVQVRVRRLVRLLEEAPLEGVVDLSPAYGSVLIRFDPLRTDHRRLEALVRARLPRLVAVTLPEPRLVEVPVCYGGAFGPDLEDLARIAGLSPREAAAIHAGTTYDAYFLGFVPGFAYLGIVPPSIACPRLDAPRRAVPAGSVGIAGEQTGIYPVPTPGGWRLIGRTPLRMFDPGRDPMALLQAGDRVRFVPIAPDRFAALAG